MKLFELDAPKSKSVASVMSSHFGKTVDFDKVTVQEARTMLPRVNKMLKEHRKTPKFHSSEKNPAYLELVMIEQALRDKVQEQESVPVDMDDPKTQSVLDKLERGQNLSTDEQEIANAVAAQSDDSQIRESVRRLNESDIEEAQVVLAAKDLVDRVQKMIEDVSEVQYKDLPALVDQATTDLGTSQADSLQQHIGPALDELMSSLQETKEKMNSGLSSLTGEETLSVPGENDEVNSEPDLDTDVEDSDEDADLDLGLDDEDTTDLDLDNSEDSDLDVNLGRERR